MKDRMWFRYCFTYTDDTVQNALYNLWDTALFVIAVCVTVYMYSHKLWRTHDFSSLTLAYWSM